MSAREAFAVMLATGHTTTKQGTRVVVSVDVVEIAVSPWRPANRQQNKPAARPGNSRLSRRA